MADLTSSTTIAPNYAKLNVDTSGLGAKTLIVTIVKDSGDATEAQLKSVIRALEVSGGSGNGSDTNGPDAFVCVGLSGTIGTDPVYAAFQGNGTINTTPVSGYTVTTVATFNV